MADSVEPRFGNDKQGSPGYGQKNRWLHQASDPGW